MRSLIHIMPTIVVLTILATDSAPVSAQCSSWLAGPLDNGTAPNGTNQPLPNAVPVQALISWDADGPGSQPPALVAGGTFTTIQDVSANRVAIRNPSTGQWQPMGAGLGLPMAFATYNNDLISARDLKRWDGANWSSIGNATNGNAPGCCVNALIVHNGELIAGGAFDSISNVQAENVARWNGSTWSPMDLGVGSGASSSQINCFTVYNGQLIAGGRFPSGTGNANYNVAKWDGLFWWPLSFSSGPTSFGEVFAMTVFNGQLIVGGSVQLEVNGPLVDVASYNGSTWQALGGGVDSTVKALAVYNGALIAAGHFDNAGGLPTANHIARWNGTTWSALGSGVGTGAEFVHCLCVHDGNLIAGGSFTTAGGVSANHLARWNGSQWFSFGGGTVDSVNALATVGSRLVAGGVFTQSTNTAQMATYIAVWNGSSLAPLSGGQVNAPVHAMKSFSLSTNYLIVGGEFTQVLNTGGIGESTFPEGVSIPANRIARWNDGLLNGGWSAMGNGFNGKVLAVERIPANQFLDEFIFAGGEFTAAGTGSPNFNRVAVWSGSPASWQALSTGFNNTVRALKGYTSGPIASNLVAGGDFTTASGVSANRIAQYGIPNLNGWVAMGSGFNFQVNAIELHSGSIYAGGWFTLSGSTAVNRIARWTGTAWTAVGLGGAGGGFNGPVFALKSSGSNLYAAGDFTMVDGIAAPRIAKWNGTSWSAVLGGADAAVFALSTFQTELVAGGTFDTVSSPAITSAGVARFTETGVPWIISGGQPSLQAVECGDTASFNVQTAPGYTSLTYQWRKNAVPLANGPTGHGSVISGATAATLTISNVRSADAGSYSCVISNNCAGSVTSGAASLSLTNTCCTPDINGNGVVDIDDLLAVINAWGACPIPPSTCPSDIAPVSGDSVVNIDDLLAVINGWGACP